MPPTADPADHFDPDNRAWQRLGTTLADHLDVITWTREDGRPVLVSLTDLHSGDIVTLAVLDSLEVRDPYALLAVTTERALTVHGPFAGDTAATSHVPHVAAADPAVAATRAAPLHHPDRPTVPDTAWTDIPASIAATLAPTPPDGIPLAVLLLDRTGGRLALVGPFPHHRAAQTWQPTPPTDPGVDRYVLTLTPAPPNPTLSLPTPPKGM